MLQWVCMKAKKMGFGVVIGKSDNDSDIRQTFVIMRCEISGMYQPLIRTLKQDDTESRKCECLFKLREHRTADETWKFNVISGIHNHALNDKLVGHPFVCRLVLRKGNLLRT